MHSFKATVCLLLLSVMSVSLLATSNIIVADIKSTASDSKMVFISKALILNKNSKAIEDVYDKVIARDSVYAIVKNGQYIRVTFEKNLTNGNDITLYAKSKTGARVQV